MFRIYDTEVNNDDDNNSTETIWNFINAVNREMYQSIHRLQMMSCHISPNPLWKGKII